MKNLPTICLLTLAMTFTGCAWIKRHTASHHPAGSNASTTPPATASTNQLPMIVTPDESLTAKVVTVNTVGQFVVLNFPDGRLPKMNEHMFLYRGGLRAAEIKIVGPQQDTSIVADIVSGDAQVGDTVREE